MTAHTIGTWRRARDRRGLTMIEVLVTLGCIAIAAMIVVPAVQSPASMQLRRAAELFVADLEFAQVQSLSRADDPRTLVFEADGTGYALAARSDPATPITDPITAGPYITRFGTGRAAALDRVQITAADVGGDGRLQFGACGQLADQTTPATITFQCVGATMTVTIDPVTGQATVGPIE